MSSIRFLNHREVICLSGPVGLSLQAGIAFLGFLLKFNNTAYFLVTSILLIVLSTLFRKNFHNNLLVTLKLYFFIVLLWIFLVSIIVVLPIYSGAYWYGDWWMHYDISLVYLGIKDIHVKYFELYSAISRTPLFNLICSYYMGIFGNEFYIYQIISILPAIFLFMFLPLYVRNANIVLTLFLVFFNSFINNVIIFPWPKTLATLYVLISVSFYRNLIVMEYSQQRERHAKALGFFLGLSILSHQSSLIYIFAIFFHSLFLIKEGKNFRLIELFLIISFALLPLSIWLFWAINAYGFYEFYQKSFVTISNSEIGLIDKMTTNLLGVFIPWAFISKLINISEYTKVENILSIWQSILRFYFDVLIGAVGLVPVSFLFLKKFVQRLDLSFSSILPFGMTWILIILGILGACILVPTIEVYGMAGASMMPLVLIMLLNFSEFLSYFEFATKKNIIIFVLLEFLLIRGFQIFTFIFHEQLGISKIVMDRNVRLKDDYKLMFARDLMPSLILPEIILILSTLLIFLFTYRELKISRTENNSLKHQEG